MTTTSWIVIAVVAVLIVLILAFVARAATRRRNRVHADRIREDVREQSGRLEKREAVAAETEAKARAAQAEAEAKAAEAARLQDRATGHREHVNTAREDLDAKRERADELDPRSRQSKQATDDTQNAEGAPTESQGNEHRRTFS
jgi:ABC-type multidrug transport system fused ATPase/permease subunit